jgi:hypothetical protein
MGSPLAPILAEIYLIELEKKFIINNTPFKNFFYYRYVDDIFMIIPDNIVENELLNYLNSLNKNLRFRMETQNNNSINFLDVIIHLNDNKISTGWFRKMSNTLTFTNWYSAGPKSYKINLIKTMIKRLKFICSSIKIYNKDIDELKLSFIRSKYPISIVERFFSNTLFKKPQIQSVSHKIIYFGINFFNNQSIRFAKNISKSIGKYFSFIKPTPYYSSGRKLISFFSSKIKSFNRDSAIGVYRISCNNCERQYIGETGRAVKIRLKEHEANCRNHSTPSAVVTHSDSGHSLDFSNSHVIYSEPHMIKRKIAEALLINKNNVIDGNINSFALKVFK